MNKMRRQSLQTRHQIEIDDPELDKLVIGRVPRFADNTHWPFTNWKNYHPHDGDWERDGEGVGRNTHIKELSFGNGLNNFGGSRVEFEAFCRGFACNKSIERLTVYGSRLFDGEIFAILSPFLENNHNLRCLKVGEEYAEHNGLPPPHPPNSARLLSGTLSRFNTLREFDCSGVFRTGSRQSQSARQSVITDVEKIIRALGGHRGLTKIDLAMTAVKGRAMTAVAALLSNPHSSLVDLNLSYEADDEGAVILAAALAKNTTLRKLDLGENYHRVTATGWTAIFTQLQSPHSSLEELILNCNSIDDGCIGLLANALTSNAHLKALNLGRNGRDITSHGWQAVFNALRSPSCVLQEIDLHNNHLNDETVTHLANSLSNNCVLRRLDLSINYDVTAVGWMAFSAVFQNQNSALEKVDFGSCSIDDNVLPILASSLLHNSKLKELDLSGNRSVITASGWRAFSAVFQNQNSALEKVDLAYCVDDNVLAILANSLLHNSKLKELFLDYDDDEDKDMNWGALSNVLCNKSSIDATFNSNHTLQRIFNPDNEDCVGESELPSDLRALLQLNRENTEFKAARRKILTVHFGGEFSIQPFIDMDLKVLPHAIAWMAKDRYASSLTYQFVRNTTFFLGVGGVTRSEEEPKSKRQKTERWQSCSIL